jgi:hypothetical protein
MSRHTTSLAGAFLGTLMALSFGAAADAPADWVSLSLIDYSGPCPTEQGANCEKSWTFTPHLDSVQVREEGRVVTSALRPPDAKLLASILTSKEFRDGLASRFECGPARTDFYRVVEATYADGSKARRYVTGCSAQSEPGRLRAVLSHY